MCTKRGVVQLDDGQPHGAAELEVYQRVDVGEGGLPGDVREYGVVEERGEHGMQPRLLGLFALVSSHLLGLPRARIHRSAAGGKDFLSPRAELRDRSRLHNGGDGELGRETEIYETDMWALVSVSQPLSS